MFTPAEKPDWADIPVINNTGYLRRTIMDWFTSLVDKMKWSIDLVVYITMMLMGIIGFFIARGNESSKSGKILVTVGASLFILIFAVLFVLKLFTII